MDNKDITFYGSLNVTELNDYGGSLTCSKIHLCNKGENVIIDIETFKQIILDIKTLKDRVKSLEDLVDYSPDGGKIYEEAKEHFQSLI